MPSPRELRLRVRSIKNLAQVTRALETVSASYVRRAIQATMATRPYSEKAWGLLSFLACQPGHDSLHPLLAERKEVKHILVIMVSGGRGLAGAYNMNILHHTLDHFAASEVPVSYLAVGRNGRDLLIRRHKDVIAEFSQLPNPPSFSDVSPIGQLAVDDFLKGVFDQVWIAYTEFLTMAHQKPTLRKLLPLGLECNTETAFNTRQRLGNSVFTYEPDPEELLSEIVPRFTAIQVYQSIISAQASEHAARMVAMHNASDSANDLIGVLQLEYNKLRQQLITNEMLDITGGAEALAR